MQRFETVKRNFNKLAAIGTISFLGATGIAACGGPNANALKNPTTTSTSANKAPTHSEDPSTTSTTQAPAETSASTHEAPESSSSTAVTTPPTTPETSPTSKPSTHEQYTGTPMAELDKAAAEGTLWEKPLDERLYWASQFADKTQDIAYHNIDLTKHPHDIENVSPSKNDDGQTIFDGYLFNLAMAEVGFQGWKNLSDGSSQLLNDANKGTSYFSTSWDFSGPDGADNLSRFNFYKNNIEQDSKDSANGVAADDLNVISAKDIPLFKTKNVPNPLATKEIVAVTETGKQVTDIFNLVKYINSKGADSTAWVVEQVTNDN